MTTLIESQRLLEPMEYAFAITPNDGANLPVKTRGLLIGGSLSDVDITLASGQRVTLTVEAGIIHPLSVIKVWTTATTATDIFGLY